MYAFLVYEENDASKNQTFINMLIEEAKNKGITLELKFYEKFTYGIRENGYFIDYERTPIKRPDFVIYRSRQYLLSRQFESMGIRTFNSSKVCEICNDKALTYQYIASLGIPMVPSMFVKNNQIESVLKDNSEKQVVKAVAGHGGKQVILTDPKKEGMIQEVIDAMAGEDVVIQPYVVGKGQDLRVYIVGGNIYAAVLRSANGDFRANFSLGGTVCLYDLSEDEKALISQINDKLSLDYAGIDFIIGKNGELIFNEIEDVVGARMLYQSSNLNVVSAYIEHVINNTYK